MTSQAMENRSATPSGGAGWHWGLKPRWMLIALCAATGLVLSAMLFFLLAHRETRLAEARFHLHAERQADRIHHAAGDLVTSLRVLAAFFAGSELVEPDEFRVFTESLVKGLPGPPVFGWAPRQAGDDGSESYAVLYRTDKDRWPVEIGWDPAAVPECREALDRARESGVVAASAPFALGANGRTAVLLAAPEENGEVEGFVIGLFAPDDVLRAALWPRAAATMDLRMYDAHPHAFLAEHRVDGPPARTFAMSPMEFEPFVHSFKLGGRDWLIECRPAASLVSARRSWLPWTAAAAAVLLTVAGVGILVLLAVQTSRVERLVATRTAEVKQSEQRLRTITGAALDAVVMMAPDGTVAYWNPAAERMFGYRRDEILGRDVHATLVPGEYREKTEQKLRRFAATGESEVVGTVRELDALRKGGGRFHAEVAVSAIRMDGGWGAVAVVRDITERRAAEEAVRKEQALLRQLIEFHERERKLLAYEIHDGLVQQLTGAHLALESLPGDPASARDHLKTAADLLRDAIAEARRLMSGLRPPILDESGIGPAVAYLVGQQQRHGGPQVELASDLGERRFAPLVETAVFRVVQEGLNNACRYSRSERVRVALRTEGDRLHVEVRDWGKGFDPAQVGADRFGLRGIRERARLLGGSAEVQSVPGEGTTIRVTLPAEPRGEGD